MNSSVVVVVGMGEVGKPLCQILGQTYDCVGVDLEPVTIAKPVSVLHICIPFRISDFQGATTQYIRKYNPEMTIINSTVSPGTTRAISELSRSPVVFSPVRGKHIKMVQDMLAYKKFVGADDLTLAGQAIEHFARAGFKTGLFRDSRVGELAKLMETTWLGILVGWAQEAERIAEKFGGTYADLNGYIEEINFLPHHIFPGAIGGHCVMPNIDILRTQLQSDFLDAVVLSNQMKQQQMESELAGGDIKLGTSDQPVAAANGRMQ